MPTRLLDWSYNPLVACYFAVEQAFDGDSAIYGFDCPRFGVNSSTLFPGLEGIAREIDWRYSAGSGQVLPNPLA